MATQASRTADIGREVATLVLAAIGDAGLSKSKVADLSGIPYSTLNRKLMGRGEFSFEELYLLAEATGRRPSDFTPSAFAQVA
ncbi:helix-turn-helix domain-containing protein [Microbacterium sp. UBA3394]|uniref:helix-turn-helix domain-containing protein n=1 Tax=Microbacterium sp. UBA3394 TaxID=1946945 RepID=UPI000C6375B4|nr:helix-turn-helix domain-containing protein [Microbacterium sp. UBA3394]MAM53389.1 hypothetical protein [Microbacterium sp.]|tara:strand:+ start:40 stop:288 length:249 start_codon:yes stop_codon:yes gene_type:complete